MSFEKKEQSSLIASRFVSETELEEIKKKREEEWEIARQQGRHIEKEEDIPYDGRTLYERLKEQKDKKQEEFEDSIKFKNMVYKGLNEEDADFLSDVSKKQADFHNRRFEDESEEMMTQVGLDNLKLQWKVQVFSKEEEVSTNAQSEEVKDAKLSKTENCKDAANDSKSSNGSKVEGKATLALGGLLAYSDTDSSEDDS
eukprot:gene19094-21010_t